MEKYSCLENPMDGGAWKAAVHWVAKSGTRLSDFTFTFHFHALEKEMATQPTPVFLPGESQGRGSLVGCVYGVAQSRTRLKQLSSSSSRMGKGGLKSKSANPRFHCPLNHPFPRLLAGRVHTPSKPGTHCQESVSPKVHRWPHPTRGSR